MLVGGMGLLLVLLPQFARADCASAAAGASSAVSRAIQACRQERGGANGAAFPRTAHLAGGQPDFCQIGSGTGLGTEGDTDSKLCADPAGAVCSMSKVGRVLDSQCHLATMGKAESAQTAEYVGVKCETDAARQPVYDKFSFLCTAMDPASERCHKVVEATHPDELRALERPTVYTAPKKAKVQAIFDRLMRTYELLIQNSAKINPAFRQPLLDKLKTLRLGFSDDVLKRDPKCHDLAPGGASTAVSFNPETEKDGTHVIDVCAGIMANLDNFNPYTLMTIIGHEIAHSIDPCILALDAFKKTAPDPTTGRRAGVADLPKNVYRLQEGGPTFMDCIRDAKGPGPCDGAALGCNTDKGIEDSCREEIKKTLAPLARCVTEAKDLPDCSWSGTDPTHDEEDSAAYRRQGEPRNQMEEGFADFLGGQVTGFILQADSIDGKLDAAGRRDALIATSAAFAGMHGPCLTGMSKDEHPFAQTRINRMLMGSRFFRHGVGCGGQPVTGGKLCGGI